MASVLPIRPNQGYVAVDQAIDGTTGLITGWTMRGSTPPNVSARLAAEGIPTEWHPTMVGADTLLSRALAATLAGNKKTLHAEAREKPLTGFWLSAKHKTGSGPALTTLGWVSADDSGLTLSPELPEALKARLQAEWLAVQVLSPSDLGGWLTDLVKRRLDGVTVLRDGGGVYFIPAPRMPLYLAVRRAFEALGSTLGKIPAMSAEGAADAVLAGLQAEAQAHADDLALFLATEAEKLAPGESKKMHGKSMKAREATLVAAREKIGRYEAVFGPRCQAIMGAIDVARQTLARSTVITRAVAEGRDVSVPAAVMDLGGPSVVVPEAPADLAARKPVDVSTWGQPVAADPDDTSAARFAGLEIED